MPGAEDADADAAAALTAGNSKAQTRRTGQEDADSIMDTDEVSDKMDEVDNREDHRLKGGRDIKATA